MSTHHGRFSKVRLESLPTLTTIPDEPIGHSQIGRTAVFRRSFVSQNTPEIIITEPIVEVNPLQARPLSRAVHRAPVHHNLFQATEQISVGSRVRHNDFTAPHPLEMMRKESVTRQNVAFLPIGSSTSMPLGIKKIVSETIATAQVIPEQPHMNEITVYQPKAAAVKPYARRNVEIRTGCCYKISNCFSSQNSGIDTDGTASSGGFLKCCPCWLMIVLSLLIVIVGAAVGIAIRKKQLTFGLFNPDDRCKQGWHFLNGKCFSCPPGAVWDGVNCIKNSLVVTGTTTSRINSDGILNQNPDDTPSNMNIYKTVINSDITPEGIDRKITRFNKSITESDIDTHHLRSYLA